MIVHCTCGKTLKVADDLVGKKVRCPGCKEVLRLPDMEAGFVEAAQVPPAKEKARPRPQSREDYGDDDTPARRKRQPQPEGPAHRRSTAAPSFFRRYGLYLGIGGGAVAAALVFVVILQMGGFGGANKGEPAAKNKDTGRDKGNSDKNTNGDQLNGRKNESLPAVEVVKSFYQAANQGNYAEVENLFSAEALSAVKDMYGAVKGLCDLKTFHGTVTSVKIQQEEMEGEAAIVYARIDYKGGRFREYDETYLIREKGVWRIGLDPLIHGAADNAKAKPRGPTAKLSGRVTFDGQPVEYGLVIAVNADKNQVGRAPVQEGGLYEMAIAPVGKVFLLFVVQPPPGIGQMDDQLSKGGKHALQGLVSDFSKIKGAGAGKAAGNTGLSPEKHQKIVARYETVKKLNYQRYQQISSPPFTTMVEAAGSTYDIKLTAR